MDPAVLVRRAGRGEPHEIGGVEYKTKWTTTKTTVAGTEMESKAKIMGMVSTTNMVLVSIKKP